MKPNQMVIRWIKQGRALIMPVRNVSGHLGYLTRVTTRQMGFQLTAAQVLESGVVETCNETGLDPLPKSSSLP